MTVAELHYAFKLGMDRVDTLSSTDFNPAEIDWLLNEAQLIFVNNRINPTSKKPRGFEGDQKRIDDLSTLVIKYPVQPAVTPTLLDTGVYEVDLGDLEYDYLHLIALYADLNLGDSCIKSIPLKFIQHDDYREALRDPFNSPSLESLPYNFGRSSNNIGVPSIFIYTGVFALATLDKVYVEYIKKPRKISLGNYKYIDGTTYPPTTSELPESVHEQLVDLACLIAANNIESPEYLQLKTSKVFMND